MYVPRYHGSVRHDTGRGQTRHVPHRPVKRQCIFFRFPISKPDHGSLCPCGFNVILSTCSTGKVPPQPGQPRQFAVINHPLSRGEAIRPADQQRQRPRLQMQPQPPQSLPRTFISTANPLAMLAHSAAPRSDQISHRSQLISGRSAFCILHSALCTLHSALCTLSAFLRSGPWPGRASSHSPVSIGRAELPAW